MARLNSYALPIALAGVSLVVSGWSSYTNNDKAFAQRLTAVETQQLNDGRSLQRIEQNLDEIRATLTEFYKEFRDSQK
jgi:propanediol dehydratase large subunit